MLIKDYPPMPLDQIPTWAESNQRQLGVPDRARAGPAGGEISPQESTATESANSHNALSRSTALAFNGHDLTVSFWNIPTVIPY